MNRSFHKSQTLRFYDCSAVEVKSKFGAEFRRFSLDRHKPGKFEDFYKLVVHTHHISNTDVTIGYADVHGDLLPINNDDNFCKAVSSANPLLRVFIQKRGTGRWGCCLCSVPVTHTHAFCCRLLGQSCVVLVSSLGGR
uniref:PB1 domain-containing protein n=1 Tax=Ursus americanus TaxID=9643 RepID=A0A452SMV0_URSAM